MNERIKSLRQKLGLTQSEFGGKIGISQNYVWMIEKGDRVPSERTLADICRVFNVDPVWLETGEGEMFRTETVDSELTRLVGELMADKPGSFRQRVITAL
ncbi:MAG: helix-turn-helix domain-containing protein, partial [Faecousia sp.]